MVELKPCPFCGGEAVLIEHEPDRPYKALYYAQCKDCGEDGLWLGTKELAIESWNSRPLEDALQSEVQRLQAQLDSIIETIRIIQEWLPDSIVYKDDPSWVEDE